MRRHTKPVPSPNSAIPRPSPLRQSEPPPASLPRRRRPPPPFPARSCPRRQSTTTPAPVPWTPGRCAMQSRSSRRRTPGRGDLTAWTPRVCPRIIYPRRRGGEMARMGGRRPRRLMNLRRVGLLRSPRLRLRGLIPAPRHRPRRRNQVCRRVCHRGQTPPPRQPHPSAPSPQGAAVTTS